MQMQNVTYFSRSLQTPNAKRVQLHQSEQTQVQVDIFFKHLVAWRQAGMCEACFIFALVRDAHRTASLFSVEILISADVQQRQSTVMKIQRKKK